MQPHGRIELRRRRAGFTLTEVLVSIAILALLMAISVPALLSARETSRRNSCANHLHQLGVALANCESTERQFTTLRHANRSMWPLLRYLDQEPLLEQLQNFQGEPYPILDVFLCPNDGVSADIPGELNYLYNGGTRFRHTREWNGFAGRASTHGRSVRANEFVDGLSNTAAMSERLIASMRPFLRDSPVTHEQLIAETGRYFWYTPTTYSLPGDELRAAAACTSDLTTPIPFMWGVWSNMFNPTTEYDHLLTPNARACYNNNFEDFSMGDYTMLIPPSSLHPGGVNLLLADGRVRFVSDSIGAAVWRAVGTRNGRESETLK